MHGEGGPPRERVPVWDRPVRVLHWLLAAAVLVCWLTSTRWHEWAGYAAGVAAAARLAWGFTGSRTARFSSFVCGPRATWVYTRALLRGAEPRHLGHNPLGGWMVVVLLGMAISLAITGWLYVNTDAFWGDPVLDRVHAALGWGLLVLVAVHVAAVFVMGHRQDENLVRGMLDGRKAAPVTDEHG